MIQPVSLSLQTQLQCTRCPRAQKLYQGLSQCIAKIVKKITEFFSNLCHFNRRTVPIPRPITPITPITPAPPSTNGPKNLPAFYRGQEPNNNGITIGYILQATDAWLEMDHKWVQWAFPVEKASAFNSTAPVLDTATILVFRSDAVLRNAVFQVFQRILLFYGLRLEANGKIVRDATFSARRSSWLHPGSHHFLRITRIIHSLGLLFGPPNVLGKAFFDINEDIYRNEGNGIIPDATYNIWKNSV